MYEEDRQLAEQCDLLVKATAQASAWLGENAGIVGRDLQGHQKELRRAARLFRNCAIAAKRKLCVGVFGPSQAGKSYLVSTLAGNAQRKLWTQLDTTAYDFLADINPAGGKESTGLVTRFTIAPQTEVPQGFPVHIRLLSVIDIAKILANTYFSDAKHMEEPDREAMLATLQRLEQRKTSSPTGGLDQDAVEDLQDYIHKYFRDKPRVQQLLDQHFWDRVIPLAPLLEDADRAELFGLIWDNIAPFTQLFLQLCTVLRATGYATEAFCPVTSLVPRATSIIDVDALSNLGTGQGDSLELVCAKGQRITVPKVYVAALTAELVITMQEQPAEFFTHTDMLDFPGYRSRETFSNLSQDVLDPKVLELCFLRGKVEYLFQRYCAERELASLLLCIGPSVLEVKGLPAAVNDWVQSTHGETPASRSGKIPSLFFILSKSDLEFESKAGANNVSDRWDIRLTSSLLNPFAQYCEWPTKWDTQGAFTNLFLMRNTTIKLGLFEHDATAAELFLRPTEQSYVAQFEQAFMDSPQITRFCAHQRETWDSFIAPNDGGISFIRAKLAPACKPELKRAQIFTTLDERLSKLRDRLSPYWKTDDKEEERKQKNILAQNLAKIILNMAQHQRFGNFLRLLMLRDQQVYDLYFQARHAMQADLAAKGDTAPLSTPVVEAGFNAEDMLADILGDALLPEAAPSHVPLEHSSVIVGQDEAKAFATHIEKYWLEQIRALAENPNIQQFFFFPPALFAQFVHELSVGFVRLGIRTAVEEALRKAARYTNTEKEQVVWKQACLASASINAYIDWLGFNPRILAEGKRTINMGGKQRVLFTPPPPPPVAELPTITEDPATYARTFYTDWTAALIYLVQQNSFFDGAVDFDPMQNTRLKAILDSLAV